MTARPAPGRIPSPLWFAALLIVSTLHPTAAAASAFNIMPTKVVLTSAESSALLAIRNDSDRTIRFQITAQTWSQEEDGRMILGATRDLIVYPPLVSVAAHEVRRIRIGTTQTPATIEGTYRIFVEEMPDEAGPPATVKAIQVRTRIGIPVFLQKGTPKAATSIEQLRIAEGGIAFRLLNTGSAHTVVQTIKLRALSGTGAEVFAGAVTGSYLLAQHALVFKVPLDPTQCEAVRRLELVVSTEDGTARQSAAVTMPVCPSTKK